MIQLLDEKRLENLINKNEYIVVCVSTGIDSMSLFHYLYNHGYKIIVAHVNHKKRIESDNEYKYLKSYCEDMNIPFEGYVMEEIQSGNFQEIARKKRYDFFINVAKKYGTKQIALAHQEDDMVETVLMRLTRGTSLRGYSGIRDVSYIGDYKIVRPLLETKRSTINDYQKENNIKYFEDSSNSENHYTRNIIRHKVTPVLKDINPNFYQSFLNYSDDLSDAYKLIDSVSLEFIDKFATIKKDEISFSFDSFKNNYDIVKRQIVLRCINILSSNTIEITHQKMKEIANYSPLSNESKVIEIIDNYKVSFEYGNITFYKEVQVDDVEIKIEKCGEYLINGYGKILLSQKNHSLEKKNTYLMCYNKTDNIYPIYVRNVKNGDKIKVNGITKKVFDLLKEHKVPKRLRAKTLIFYNDEGIFFIPNIIRKETNTLKEEKLFITYLGE